MTNKQSILNYNSHSWVSKKDPLTGENYVYCNECKCENLGDPREFEIIEYINCNEDAMVSHDIPLIVIEESYVE